MTRGIEPILFSFFDFFFFFLCHVFSTFCLMVMCLVVTKDWFNLSIDCVT